jgi:hypothetical protein
MIVDALMGLALLMALVWLIDDAVSLYRGQRHAIKK